MPTPDDDARKLGEYRRKRDFAATPEPAGGPAAAGGAGVPGDDGELSGRFVIQQHDATRLHWDLRLEHDGVLLSWALPRGLPWDPQRNHLAVHTEDHPLEYLDFAGDIPDGSYGAGHMDVWDHGTYTAEKITPTKVTFTLAGRRSEGRYALFQTGGRNWMIHRMDPPADPERRHPPGSFALIDPVPGPPPDGDGWALETRWHGARAVLVSSGGVVEVGSRDGWDMTAHLPELRPLGRRLGYTEVVLDGIVTAPAGGAARLGRRLQAASDSARRRLSRDEPVTYVAVDLLWLDGHPVTDRPWHERRERLEDLRLDGPAWTTPAAYTGPPRPMLEAAAADGTVDGLVAKRVDAPYDPDLDPPPWRLVILG
ncbi:MAG TPA: DNA polymerase ligase N-terminal domain-containing protein [Acidimicrobiales bacterium]|nr:DNA polymerase ligase N-terminal domain-containing protein [Acidimicrobiales bacterium]